MEMERLVEPVTYARKRYNLVLLSYSGLERKLGPKKLITNEATTMRRHIEYKHKVAYNQWCLSQGFESKLPKAVKARKQQNINNSEGRFKGLL